MPYDDKKMFNNRQTNYKHSFNTPTDIHDVTRVTFFATEQTILTRVLKMASAAHFAGIKIQLIVCFPPEQDYIIDSNIVEEVLVFPLSVEHINEILASVHKFGSSLCHVFVGCSSNFNAALLVLGLHLPVVGDPYDLCRAQYVRWENEKELQKNVFYESLWFKVVDSICIRNHYFKTKEFLSAYTPGKAIFYAPDPVRKNRCRRNTHNIEASKLNIMVDGMGSSEAAHKAAFMELLNITKTSNNFKFFIYRNEYDFSKIFGDNIKIFPLLEPTEYEELMLSCDAFMIPWAYDYVKNSGYSDNLKLSTRSTATDILEADIVNITPDYFELTGKNTLKCGRAIIFNQEDQRNPDFWKSLPQRVAQIRSAPSDLHQFLDSTIGPHLKSFYQRTIRYAEKNSALQSRVRSAILRALQKM